MPIILVLILPVMPVVHTDVLSSPKKASQLACMSVSVGGGLMPAAMDRWLISRFSYFAD